MGIKLGIGEDRRIDVMSVSPHGIGCRVVNTQTGGHIYSQWFPPQQPIPFEGSFDYFLLTPDQPNVRFGIYQSTIDQDGQDIDDTEFTGCENQIVNIPPTTDGTCRSVTTDVKYDESGLLHVVVTIPSTGQSMTLEFKETASASESSKKAIADFTKKWHVWFNALNQMRKRLTELFCSVRRLRFNISMDNALNDYSNF